MTGLVVKMERTPGEQSLNSGGEMLGYSGVGLLPALCPMPQWPLEEEE